MNRHLAFKCNAEELALIAQEIGAEVVQGVVRFLVACLGEADERFRQASSKEPTRD